MTDQDLPYNREDHAIYEAGDGALEAQFVIFTVDASFNAENNPAIERFLESVKALKTGSNTWLVQTNMTPSQIVNCIRRHLAVNDAVYAFTVCNQCSWAGPRFVRKFFELYSARIQHSVEIPPPPPPENEP